MPTSEIDEYTLPTEALRDQSGNEEDQRYDGDEMVEELQEEELEFVDEKTAQFRELLEGFSTMVAELVDETILITDEAKQNLSEMTEINDAHEVYYRTNYRKVTASMLTGIWSGARGARWRRMRARHQKVRLNNLLDANGGTFDPGHLIDT